LVDWFTVLMGLLVTAALMHHGALWLHLKTEGALEKRSGEFARKSFWAVLFLFALATVATFFIQPLVLDHLKERPWVWALPIAALLCFFRGRVYLGRSLPLSAFLCSSLFLALSLATAVFSLYPTLLPSVISPDLSLTVDTASAPEYGLKVGLYWWIPGMILAISYFTYAYRKFAGKVRLEKSS
jgi:cytochrome bd ubiquinol oxidase subunit II